MIIRRGVATERSERDRGVIVEGANHDGGEESFESLFRRHYPRLVQTLCLTTLDRETAADVAQEAFLRLHLEWERVSHYENRVGWVYRVAINRSRDYRRRSLRLLRLGQSQPRTAIEPEGIVWKPERGFFQALKELPDRQRQAVALHYVAGFSQKETAEAMGLSEGAVKSHLFRARETLRRKLGVES
jgi:RNA polymerase sigma-70 factor (sigma-E family)